MKDTIITVGSFCFPVVRISISVFSVVPEILTVGWWMNNKVTIIKNSGLYLRVKTPRTTFSLFRKTPDERPGKEGKSGRLPLQ